MGRRSLLLPSEHQDDVVAAVVANGFGHLASQRPAVSVDDRGIEMGSMRSLVVGIAVFGL